MTLLKLKDGGEAVRMFVQRITDDMSKKGPPKPQYMFAGRTEADEDTAIWLFASTAERQFARIGLTRDTVIGKWVAFSKTPNGYIDINLPAGTPAAAAPAPAAKPAPAKPDNKTPQGFSSGPLLPGEPGYVDPKASASTATVPASNGTANGTAPMPDRKLSWRKTTSMFEACLDHVLATSAPKLSKADVGTDPQAIAILTAALFERCASRGLDV